MIYPEAKRQNFYRTNTPSRKWHTNAW